MCQKFLGKRLSLVKNISGVENNFTRNKYNKLQKISAKLSKFFAKNKSQTANIGSSTVRLHGIDLIDIQIQYCL